MEFYCPEMVKAAAKMQRACMQCHEPLNIKESLFVQEVEDWRWSYLDFLLHRMLPFNCSDATKIKKKSSSSLLKKVYILKML